jgi:predicted RecA/RadA family phage recombinase
MATNQTRENGRHLRVTPSNGGATSGAPLRYGALAGVAETDVDDDGITTADFGGVYELSVKGVDGGGNSAVAPGDAIYYVDGDTPKLSKKTAGTLIGYAYAPLGATGNLIAAGATATINVIIRR